MNVIAFQSDIFFHVNQECEILISLFFVVKSRFDTPVFLPRECHVNVINDSFCNLSR